MAAILALLLWLLRQVKPNLRYLLSVLALIACVALSLKTFVSLTANLYAIQAPSPAFSSSINSRAKALEPNVLLEADSPVRQATLNQPSESPTLVPEITLRRWKMKLEQTLSQTLEVAKADLEMLLERCTLRLEKGLEYEAIGIKKLVEVQYGALLAVLDSSYFKMDL